MISSRMACQKYSSYQGITLIGMGGFKIRMSELTIIVKRSFRLHDYKTGHVSSWINRERLPSRTEIEDACTMRAELLFFIVKYAKF